MHTPKMLCVRVVIPLGFMCILKASIAAPPPLWNVPNSDGLQKFQQARFGLFVHFGPVTQWGDEISFPLACEVLPCKVQGPNRTEITITTEFELATHREAYASLANTFNPASINLTAMADLAWEAGMRYVTWIVVHCDGFTNYDSKLTSYKITETPYGKDLFAEVKSAFGERGHRVGAYYCPSVWNRDDYWAPNASTALGGCCKPSYTPGDQPSTWDSFLQYFHGQLKEIA